jgi:hypothetical protein
MNIFKKIAVRLDLSIPSYTQEEYQQYQDGFAMGYPLRGQPEYPNHGTPAYKRGVRLGKKAFQSVGSPVIEYEESGEE